VAVLLLLHDHMSFPKHSMITWPCHMIWLPNCPCYLYLDLVIWLDVRDQMSASKVQWLELSQLSLCSEFDKENLMEFSLNSLLLIHFTTMAICLLSHSPHVTLVMWHTVTVTCDMTICHTIVTLWQNHVILSCTPSCSCKSNKKRKEKKRNINNDLVFCQVMTAMLNSVLELLWHCPCS